MGIIVYWLNRKDGKANLNYLKVFDDIETAHNKYMELKEDFYNPETDTIHLVSNDILPVDNMELQKYHLTR